MLNAIILIIWTTFSVNAQTNIDLKLSEYIKTFQLKPLEKPTNVNTSLRNLGHSLFTDPILSGNKNISCRDCHHPRNMTMDGLPLGLGEGSVGIQIAGNRRVQKTGRVLARNTPALFNLNGISTMFWDGRISFDPLTKTFITPSTLGPEIEKTLTSAISAQAIFPIVNHEEMRGQVGSNPIANAQSDLQAWSLITERVMNDPEYKKAFSEIFPNEVINIGHIGEALAEFQRTAFFYADTAYDQYLAGDISALTEVQKMGMDVFFGKGKCGECHNGEHLSNFEFHSIGAPQIGPGKLNGNDLGRFEWDQSKGNLYAFRVPPLRNVALTGPFMHDGSIKTIAQVVEHYDMVVESFRNFRLVNNWKNYVEKLSDHDHSNDEQRIESLSEKLTLRLEFEEEEERALTEFISTALTDKRLLAREIDGNYSSYYRLQLKESGFDKLSKIFSGEKETQVFYYFDALLEGGYFLRELPQPIRLLLIKKDTGSVLVYREEVYKSATAVNSIVLSNNFHREEVVKISDNILKQIEAPYLDMFDRIYTYHDGIKQEEIPQTELFIIKSNIEQINKNFHSISFAGSENISDKLNQSKESIFYVPTSYNNKEVTTIDLTIDGKDVTVLLQKSTLRTETGAIERTFAIEFECDRMTKIEATEFGKKIINELRLTSNDIGGGSPSPSKLTIDVIGKALASGLKF